MKRKMTAKQRKYFGKRSSVKVVRVARRRSFAKHSYSRARGLGGGKFTGMLPPLIGGMADSFLGDINILGFKLPTGVGSAAIGHFMGSQTTRDIGLYQIGASLPGMFLGKSGVTNSHIGQTG